MSEIQLNNFIPDIHIYILYMNVMSMLLYITNDTQSCADEFILYNHITVLFNMFLNCGTNVIHVYKKGDQRNFCNYRPISLLLLFSKVLEKVVYDSLYNQHSI